MTHESRNVTLIHEALTPSESVRHSLNKFLDKPMSEVRLFTTAYRLLDLTEYRMHRYDIIITEAEKQLQELSKRAIEFTGRTKLREHADGSARLFIEPKNQGVLDEYVAAMDMIPSLERPLPIRSSLFVDFARGSLAKDIEKRRDAQTEFDTRTRHPGTKLTFRAGNPRISGRDLLGYQLPVLQAVPDDE